MTTIISVEGNIGSGKSTILRILEEKYKNNSKIIFLQEPVEEWNKITDKENKTILSKFYENQEKYSFSFQMMAYISRLALIRETIQKNPGVMIITERCLETDRHVFEKMLYDSGKIEEIEHKIYLRWFDHFANEIKVNKIIYLKTSPETSFYRVGKRNREGESSIPLDYLIECNKYHENMIEKISSYGMTILTLESDIDSSLNQNIITKWVDEVDSFLVG
jgi:deoxyadenosine/deoxycytidine kinase